MAFVFRLGYARRRTMWAWLLWLLMQSLLQAGSAPSVHAVRLRVVEESEEVVPARFYAWRDGEAFFPELQGKFHTYERGQEKHFLAEGDLNLLLPEARYRFRVERGLEYVPVEVEFELESPLQREIRLQRWIDLAADNWYAADLHVHRDPAEIELILQAEDLYFVPTITHHVWSNEQRQAFLAGLKKGRSFTTNGPVLMLTVQDREPGEEVSVQPGEPVRIRGWVRSRNPIQKAQLVANGKVIAEYPGGGRKEIRIENEVVVDRSSWIALRAFEASPRTVVFGHTSPVYLQVDRQPVRVPEDALYLMGKMEELIRYTQQVEGFRSEEHREQTLELYRKAREVYRRLAEP